MKPSSVSYNSDNRPINRELTSRVSVKPDLTCRPSKQGERYQGALHICFWASWRIDCAHREPKVLGQPLLTTSSDQAFYNRPSLHYNIVMSTRVCQESTSWLLEKLETWDELVTEYIEYDYYDYDYGYDYF